MPGTGRQVQEIFVGIWHGPVTRLDPGPERVLPLRIKLYPCDPPQPMGVFVQIFLGFISVICGGCAGKGEGGSRGNKCPTRDQPGLIRQGMFRNTPHRSPHPRTSECPFPINDCNVATNYLNDSRRKNLIFSGRITAFS